MAKDVESMNHFELMNEVERLRNGDEAKKLATQIGWLKQELRIARERLRAAERVLERMSAGPNLRGEDRRKQPQGRRKAVGRRVVKS